MTEYSLGIELKWRTVKNNCYVDVWIWNIYNFFIWWFLFRRKFKAILNKDLFSQKNVSKYSHIRMEQDMSGYHCRCIIKNYSLFISYLMLKTIMLQIISVSEFKNCYFATVIERNSYILFFTCRLLACAWLKTCLCNANQQLKILFA